MRLRIVRSVTVAFAGIFAASTLAFGQGVTGAALSGRVVTQAGQPLEAASVTAVHEPTGSTYQTLTRADGRFNLPGVRVGGPYTVTATFIGYGDETADGIRLALAEDRRIEFILTEQAVELEGLQVVAERGAILSAERTGAQTNVSEREIGNLPSIQRSIQDFARLAPQAVGTNIGSDENIGAVSIGGKNNRFNNVQVDGAILNDVFGLPSSGTPGGQANAQPISLDAIQEFNVNVAPYDVRESGFTGGLINAVTRSGTNRYEGSAYFFGRNQDLVGALDGDDIEEFDEFWTGGRFGGPIVEDKAFFFLSGEVKRNSRPLEVGLLGSDATTVFPVPESDLNRIIQIAEQQYGYDPGGFGNLTRDVNDFKLFGRLDFNLSDRHRLTVRHAHTNADADRGISRDDDDYGLESQGYVFESVLNSSVVQLDSRIGNSASNELRLSYQRTRDKRNPDFAPFPEVEIEVGPGGEEVVLGVERFSQANALDQDVVELTDNFTFYRGDHAITIGTHNEWFKFSNLFIQDFYGQYNFESIDDFEAGIPDVYRHSFSTTGVPEQRAEWDAFQLGVYAQDEWQATPKLNLTVGLRLDVPILPDDPAENAAFAETFGEFGLSTSDVPSGNLLFSPRLGFNYDVTGDRTTQVRGGAGLFTGRNPFVWLSNQYSNTGVEFGRIEVFGTDNTPTFSPDPFDQPKPGEQGLAAIETSEVNLTDPDFKFPQSFRANLAVDRQLMPGLIGTVEGIYTKNVEDIFFQDLNLLRTGERAIDGRVLFSDNPVDERFTGVFLLTNTSKGYQYQLTGSLQKQFGEGFLPAFSGSLAYTFGQARDANSGRSSRAISNFQFNEIGIDPNSPVSSRSDFEIRHSIVASASYRLEYSDGWATTLTGFFTAREGRPFTYIYFGDANNDGRRFNDIIFVPGNADDAIFDTSCSGCLGFAVWDEFVASDAGLSDARGGIAPRNSSREPWVNQLDFRLTQEIPSVQGHALELTLDVQNFLNLLNDDWGLQRFAGFQAPTILSFRGYDEATGKPIVRFTQRDFNDDGRITQDDVFQTDNLLSRWAIQLGARYSFGF